MNSALDHHDADLDPLLNHLLPFAIQMIEKHGEFYPFGAIVREDGELGSVAAMPSDDPDTSEVLVLLESAIHEGFVSGIRAAAICMDVRVQRPGADVMTDAIRVWMQHSAGDPIDVFMPYEKRRLRRPQFGELFSTPADAPLFPTEA